MSSDWIFKPWPVESGLLPEPDCVLAEGAVIHLQTPEEYNALPNGTPLYNIQGQRRVKGADYIDNDIRFGHLAYGTVDNESVNDN